MDPFTSITLFLISFISIVLAGTYYLSNLKRINILSVIISTILCILTIYTAVIMILLLIRYSVGTLEYTYYVDLANFLLYPSIILGIDLVLLITVLRTIIKTGKEP